MDDQELLRQIREMFEETGPKPERHLRLVTEEGDGDETE